jgi:hypothetical protein
MDGDASQVPKLFALVIDFNIQDIILKRFKNIIRVASSSEKFFIEGDLNG